MEALAHLRLPILPHRPPTILPSTHPLIHAIHDITVAVKTVAQNPAS